MISLMGEACSRVHHPCHHPLAVIKHGADKLHSLRDTRGGDFRIRCPRFVLFDNVAYLVCATDLFAIFGKIEGDACVSEEKN